MPLLVGLPMPNLIEQAAAGLEVQIAGSGTLRLREDGFAEALGHDFVGVGEELFLCDFVCF